MDYYIKIALLIILFILFLVILILLYKSCNTRNQSARIEPVEVKNNNIEDKIEDNGAFYGNNPLLLNI